MKKRRKEKQKFTMQERTTSETPFDE